MQYEDFGPVDVLTVSLAQTNPPLFVLQGRIGPRRVTVMLSLELLQALGEGIPSFLAEVHRRFPELPPEESVVPMEQVAVVEEEPYQSMPFVDMAGLGYERENDLVVLELKVVQEPQERFLRIWCTRDQILQLAVWTLHLLRSTLPICPQCGRVVQNLETHLCPRKNGHNVEYGGEPEA